MTAVSTHLLRGLAVSVHNTRPEIATPAVLERLERALGLIDRYTPHYGRHLRRDFAGLRVERYACRGAFFPDSRICLVELPAAIASYEPCFPVQRPPARLNEIRAIRCSWGRRTAASLRRQRAIQIGPVSRNMKSA